MIRTLTGRFGLVNKKTTNFRNIKLILNDVISNLDGTELMSRTDRKQYWLQAASYDWNTAGHLFEKEDYP